VGGGGRLPCTRLRRGARALGHEGDGTANGPKLLRILHSGFAK